MNLVCTSCIQAAKIETWLTRTSNSKPSDLCISLGAQMSAHDCAGSLSQHPCQCSYPHDRGLESRDPIQVLQWGQKYALTHGINAIAAEGMRRTITRALVLLMGQAIKGTLPKEPNTRNLSGIRCPKCGSYEPFFITFGAMLVYDQTIIDAYVWELDSDIKCNTCGHSGIVGEFQQNLTAGEIMRLEGKEGKGRTNIKKDHPWPTN